MTPRERELLAAVKPVFVAQCLRDPTIPGLDRLSHAIDAYSADSPQADHDACLARRVAEDGPPPVTDAPGFDGRDGGRMNINSIGGE